ncbi:hypothetical protein CEUSTIGMA_g166.t1 [Chlamydomonas eustigma]|uniref:PPM-type phosphatase domain-containing protein n=1 Tax=Chlamydomonas eustigma TaxID=1157962 RepID=A0A250WQ85_9CHLO|nr:hypothetical protein CEUSTIGMA_g166.t1 [Chlamydomonas eustigma]|eukprot:GAX72710.1 hypothetical protein CEUSTIGMA_g166.t1 [Chlamydomonas eustigma]
MLDRLRHCWKKLIRNRPNPRNQPLQLLHSGKDGSPPSCSYDIFGVGNRTVQAACTGPDIGISEYSNLFGSASHELKMETDWAYGRSTSLYDVGPSGVRAGEPIADCFAVVRFQDLNVLTVADGVGWGEPSKRAARSAVFGAISFLIKELPQLTENGSRANTDQVFQIMLKALDSAQQVILAQSGTQTTLVMTVVARLTTPVRRDGIQVSSAASKRHHDAPPSYASGKYYRWVALTVNVGDSAAFVYRRVERVVEELTYASHKGTFRDPHFTPGALGFANGRDPDLGNLTCSVSLLNEGDVVFLTSDGVIDNFNPFVLKTARQLYPRVSCDVQSEASNVTSTADDLIDGYLPALGPHECHNLQMDLLTLTAVEALSKLSAPTASSSQSFSAHDLVEGLLTHVMKVTEGQRIFAQEKVAAREAAIKDIKLVSTEKPLLSTSGIRCLSKELAIPGKMDHATVVAYIVGGGRKNGTSH